MTPKSCDIIECDFAVQLGFANTYLKTELNTTQIPKTDTNKDIANQLESTINWLQADDDPYHYKIVDFNLKYKLIQIFCKTQAF